METDVSLINECFVWRGATNDFGYGRKQIGGAREMTHRMAYAWANGLWGEDGIKIPNGMCVLHKCDNPPCVNPEHLFLGTRADNAVDRDSKGRHGNSRKTHCKNGHEFTSENTELVNGSARRCVTCKKEYDRQRWTTIRGINSCRS